MNKAALRNHVAKKLAELGYSHAWYGWFKEGRKTVLGVHHPETFKRTTFYLPVGKTSKKRLEEVLSSIPPCGVARDFIALAARDVSDQAQAEMFGDRR
jgi:hypothetical protein